MSIESGSRELATDYYLPNTSRIK